MAARQFLDKQRQLSVIQVQLKKAIGKRYRETAIYYYL
jgi:hypothetical protein